MQQRNGHCSHLSRRNSACVARYKWSAALQAMWSTTVLSNGCDNSPCLNGGVCYLEGDFGNEAIMCQCAPGFDGRRCEHNAGCPSNSHCTGDNCPHALSQAFSYHWNPEFIAEQVAQRSVCTCDIGYASTLGCIGQCSVHGNIRAAGQCTAVLRLTVPDMVSENSGQIAGFCDQGPMEECLRGRDASDQELDQLRMRWSNWQPWLNGWPANGTLTTNDGPITDGVSEKDRLCFDLKRALTGQLACQCDECSQEPSVGSFDMLGDGTCVYEARGCTLGEKAMNIGLGLGFLVLGVCGILGLWAMKYKKKLTKTEKEAKAKERWKGAINRHKGGGGMLAVMRAAVAKERMLTANGVNPEQGTADEIKNDVKAEPAAMTFLQRVKALKEKEELENVSNSTTATNGGAESLQPGTKKVPPKPSAASQSLLSALNSAQNISASQSSRTSRTQDDWHRETEQLRIRIEKLERQRKNNVMSP